MHFLDQFHSFVLGIQYVFCLSSTVYGMTRQQKILLEAVAQRCSLKKVFLKISQNSQENTCTRVYFLIKLQNSGMQLY